MTPNDMIGITVLGVLALCVLGLVFGGPSHAEMQRERDKALEEWGREWMRGWEDLEKRMNRKP